jgi:hypothetical protein
MVVRSRALAALTAGSLLVSPICALAQGTLPQAAQPATAPAAAPSEPATARLPEGTEIRFTLAQSISSKTAAEGDEFEIVTSEPIDLAGGAVLPAGFHGRGEVTNVEHRGMLGKPGQLSVRLDYVRIGETKVRLRSNQGREGKSNVGGVIVLSLLVTPLFLLMKGKDAVIPMGQTVTGYADDDAEITLPATPPAA